MYIRKINADITTSSEPYEGESSDYKSRVGMADYSDTPYSVNDEDYIYCVGIYTYSKNYVEEWVDETPALFTDYDEAYEHFNQLCSIHGTTESMD